MIRRALEATVDMLYPLRCAGCGRFGMVICPECIAGLKRATGEGRCKFCAAEWKGADNCPRCVHLHELAGIRAAFEMTGTARSLVHALKYRHYRAVAPTMGAFIAPLVDDLGVESFFAVPLHKSRMKERGFNQAELLMKHAGWPPAPGLARARKTNRQVGQRLGERRSNVAGAFVYSGPRLDGRTVCLVDDVVTTGATALECARVLKDAGARAVWVVAFARASYRFGADEPIED
ncbi:MAG: double zinc ribbon domain-containing protein [Dehalococcoidia bacterium]